MSFKNNIYIRISSITYLSLFFFIFLRPLYGDVIYLKGSKTGIPIETSEVSTGYIITSIPKTYIDSVTMAFNKDSKGYLDAIFLNEGANKINCKIIEMSESTLVVRLPLTEVKSLQMVFSGGEAPIHNPIINESRREDSDDLPKRLRKNKTIDEFKDIYPDNNSLDIVMLDETEDESGVSPAKQYSVRDEIKKEMLSEIQNDRYVNSQQKKSVNSSPNADLLDRVLNKNEDNLAMGPKMPEEEVWDKSLGKINGRFLNKGAPLSNCQVRIIKLRKEGLVYYKDTEDTNKFEVITDTQGAYTFENVPPGAYKIYWKPQWETSWIRRVNMEPDVYVAAGEIVRPDDIETNQRILN